MLNELPLHRQLRLGLDNLQLEKPTPVQADAIPVALSGRDLLVSAETGSGKTLAYLIPLVQNILESETDKTEGTLALILVPTRELARQVMKQARMLLDKSDLKAQAITGGADTRYQKSLLRKDPEIVVATPGRLLELSKSNSVKLQNLQTLVLDEADRMLDMGFRDDVLRLAQLCPKSSQILLTSATLKHRGVASIAKDLLDNPAHISVSDKGQIPASITHQAILADSLEHKDRLLPALVKTSEARRILVFANKRSTAARLSTLLEKHDVRCGCLHGELSTEARKHVVEQFRSDKIRVLCASDVAARGLDIAQIDLVVNYDVPYSGDDYLHRVGRSGRAGESGVAISFVTAGEWNNMISIQRYLDMTFERISLPGLKARYSGPKKLKSSGKAAGSKKKKQKKAEDKKRSRTRNSKNKGKSKGKTPRDNKAASSNDGFAPLTRKRSSE